MENDSLNFNLKLLAKSSFIVFIGLFFSKVFTYLYRIIMARYFGPEIYGVFSLAIMILGVFVSFSLLGLSEGLLRYIPFYRGKNKKNEISYLFKYSIYLSIFSSIFFGIILYFSSRYISINLFHSEELIIFLKIFSLLIIINVLANLFLTLIKSFERINIYIFSMNFLSNLIKVLTLIILILFGIESKSVPLSYFAGIFVMFLFSFFYCKYKLPEIFLNLNLNKKIKFNLRKEILIYSIPLMFYGFISSIFYWTDSFFIGYFKTPYEVGIYNAAIPIAFLLSFVPELFMQLFFPIINKEYSKKNYFLITELSKQVNKWISLINLPILIILLFFSEFFLNLLFGDQYLSAKISLIILLIGQFFFSISLISHNLILMKGKSKLILFDMVVVFLLNILLNYFLIPMEKIWFIENLIGINGAAISTTISLSLLSSIFLLQARKNMQIFPFRKKMIQILLSLFFSIIVLFGLREIINNTFFSITLTSFCFLLIYLLLLILFKSLDRNDLMILHTIKKNLSKRDI